MISEILSFLIKNPKYISMVPDNIFNKEAYDFFRCLSTYYEKYEKSPEMEEMLHFSQSTVECDWEVFSDFVGDVYTVSNVEYAKDTVVEQIKNFRSEQLINELIVALKDEDFELIEKINNSFSLEIKENEELEYFDNSKKRFIKYNNRDVDVTIPTGIKELDTVFDGGLSKGELGYVLAPPSGGKTGFLINVGYGCMNNGGNVLHVTLEISGIKTAKRYDKRIANVTDEDLYLNGSKIKKRIDHFKEKTGSGLKILKYPTKTYSINDLRADIDRIGSELWKPDLVIIDYADLMKSKSRSERRFELIDTYEQLRGIAESFDVAMWSASQSNRGGLEKAKISVSLDMEDAAECFDKNAIVDVGVSIIQSPEDFNRQIIKIYVMKNREGKRYQTFICHVDWAKTFIGNRNYNG